MGWCSWWENLYTYKKKCGRDWEWQLIRAEGCACKEAEWVLSNHCNAKWPVVGWDTIRYWVLWGVSPTISFNIVSMSERWALLSPFSILLLFFCVWPNFMCSLHLPCFAPHHPHPITYLWLPPPRSVLYFCHFVSLTALGFGWPIYYNWYA